MRAMPKFTKTPRAIVAAFEGAKPARADVERRTMFGYPAYFVRGNMFAFTFGPKVAVRLGPKASARPFEVMPGRAMSEYVEVPAGAVKGAALKKWVADGLAYVDALPAKRPRAGAKRTTLPAARKRTAKR